MERLPAELITRILSELDQTSLSRCAQLSRRLNHLAMQQILWRRIRIRAIRAVNPDLIGHLSDWLSGSLQELRADRLIALELGPLLRKSFNLQKFTIEKPQNESDFLDRYRQPQSNPLLILGCCCPRLRSLRLLCCGWLLTEGSLRQLLTGCPHLSELEIQGYSEIAWKSASNPRNFVSLFAAIIGRLTVLNMEVCHTFLRGILSALPDCSSLRSLTLCSIGVSELQLLLPRLSQLSELSLLNTTVDCATVASIAVPGRLHTMRLDFCTLLTDASLKCSLTDCFPQLRRLSVGETGVLDGISYRLLLNSLSPYFEELRLFCHSQCSLTDSDLAEPLPSGLKRLSLRLLPHPDTDGLTGLQLPIGLARCRDLTHLTLDVCHDDRVPALLVQLPSLRCLRLLDCRRLTRQVWSNLRAVPIDSAADLREFMVLQYPQLSGMSVKSEPSLTDEALADLCASPIARGLRRLWLSGCTQLTPAALVSIQVGCPWMNHVVMADCDAVSEADIQAFVAMYEHPVRLTSARDAIGAVSDMYKTLWG